MDTSKKTDAKEDIFLQYLTLSPPYIINSRVISYYNFILFVKTNQENIQIYNKFHLLFT